MKKLKEIISINEGDDGLEKYWQDILDLSIIISGCRIGYYI